MIASVILGPRLRLVASKVPQKAHLGDIGTDHAYLPIYLWEQGRIEKAVAVDVHKGPYQSARSAIRGRQLESVIDVRFGDGLNPIQPGEVDALTLAGMGGNTMLEIFAARPEVMAEVKNLVLQPQGAEGKVRLTLLQSGWNLVEEQLVEEEGRIYVVMHYSRELGKTYEQLVANVKQRSEEVLAYIEKDQDGSADIEEEILTRLIWDFGPLICDHPAPDLRYLIEEQIQIIERATREMQKSNKPEIQERIQYQHIKQSLLEGLKQCQFPSV